jgi:hypothetical protein
MAITRQTYRVWYEDETSVDVVVDQRDIAAFERAAGVGVNKAKDTMTIVMIRNVAYQALRRTGKLPAHAMKVEAWDQTVIEVEPLDDESVVDPTKAEATSTGPSDSPSTPV